jgi:hypothetical protein
MFSDNLPERNVHTLHCTLKVAEWSMRDVLDLLARHFCDIAEYPAGADTEEMARVDAANRAAAAKFLSGY